VSRVSQLNTVQAICVMEDGASDHGIGAVGRRMFVPSGVWPRDIDGPAYFNPLTMAWVLDPPRITHGGGLLALGPGLGKTLITIALTMLKRGETLAAMDADPLSMCSVGTVVVVEEYLQSHWRDQIRLHAPGAAVGTRGHLYRPKPAAYVDFVVVDADTLLAAAAVSKLRINRLCYDEAHKLVRHAPRLHALKIAANAVWAITATPGHALYLSQHFDNITKVLDFPKLDPACAKFFPDRFNDLRAMIISGGGGVVTDDLLPNLVTTNTYVPINGADRRELDSIVAASHVDLADDRTLHDVIHAARRSSAYVREPPQNTNGLRAYARLPVVNKAGLFGADDDCSICYDAIRHPVAIACGHVFCYECATRFVTNECALCRVPFQAGDLRAVVSAVVSGPQPAPPAPGKSVWRFTTAVDAVLRAVRANEQRARAGKTIIFCDTAFVVPLSTHLRSSAGLGSLWFLSATSERRRNATITAFKADPSKRILVIDISLNAGLDLPCADNILFACLDPVSPDSHVFKQAVGRVRRLSQTSAQVRADILHFETYGAVKSYLLGRAAAV
jgi:hypothetical protein